MITRHAAQDRSSTVWNGIRRIFSFTYSSQPDLPDPPVGRLFRINEEFAPPRRGYAGHPHAGIDVITIPVKGEFTIKNPDGDVVLTPGMVHVTNCGEVTNHAEFNSSRDEEAHYYQLWIRNDQPFGKRGQSYCNIDALDDRNRWIYVAGQPTPYIQQQPRLELQNDAWVFIAVINEGASLEVMPIPGKGYMHIVQGTLKMEGQEFEQGFAGDGFTAEAQPSFNIRNIGSELAIMIGIANL